MSLNYIKDKTIYKVKFQVSDDYGPIYLDEYFTCYDEAKNYYIKLESLLKNQSSGVSVDISNFTDKGNSFNYLDKVIGLFKITEEFLF